MLILINSDYIHDYRDLEAVSPIFSCFHHYNYNPNYLLGKQSELFQSFLPCCLYRDLNLVIGVGGCWILLGWNWSSLGFSVKKTADFEVLNCVLWSAEGSPHLDRSIMGRGDCWLIPQGKEKDTIRQLLEREVEGKKSWGKFSWGLRARRGEGKSSTVKAVSEAEGEGGGGLEMESKWRWGRTWEEMECCRKKKTHADNREREWSKRSKWECAQSKERGRKIRTWLSSGFLLFAPWLTRWEIQTQQ